MSPIEGFGKQALCHCLTTAALTDCLVTSKWPVYAAGERSGQPDSNVKTMIMPEYDLAHSGGFQFGRPKTERIEAEPIQRP